MSNLARVSASQESSSCTADAWSSISLCNNSFVSETNSSLCCEVDRLMHVSSSRLAETKSSLSISTVAYPLLEIGLYRLVSLENFFRKNDMSEKRKLSA